MSSGSPYSEAVSKDPITVHTANYVEMKITVEEQLKSLLQLNFKLKENHSVLDYQLSLGYLSFFLAAGGAFYSFHFGFSSTKLVTFLCLVGYSIVSGVLGLFNLSLKKDRVYVGVRKDPLGLDPDQHLTIDSRLDKKTGDHILVFTFHSKTKKSSGFTLVKSFGNWFDVNGVFAAKKFESEMSENISNGLKMLMSSSSSPTKKKNESKKDK